MEDSIRQRIKDVLSKHHSNTNRLAGDDTAFQNRLSRQINQGSSISCDTVARVLMAFPDVSAEWLLRGQSQMLISDNLPKFHGLESDSELDVHASLARMAAELEEYKLQNMRLQAQKDYLQERNDDLVVSNRMLQDELNKYQEPRKKDIV